MPLRNHKPVLKVAKKASKLIASDKRLEVKREKSNDFEISTSQVKHAFQDLQSEGTVENEKEMLELAREIAD